MSPKEQCYKLRVIFRIGVGVAKDEAGVGSRAALASAVYPKPSPVNGISHPKGGIWGV